MITADLRAYKRASISSCFLRIRSFSLWSPTSQNYFNEWSVWTAVRRSGMAGKIVFALAALAYFGFIPTALTQTGESFCITNHNMPHRTLPPAVVLGISPHILLRSCVICVWSMQMPFDLRRPIACSNSWRTLASRRKLQPTFGGPTWTNRTFPRPILIFWLTLSAEEWRHPQPLPAHGLYRIV